jgi:hypothetical protein
MNDSQRLRETKGEGKSEVVFIPKPGAEDTRVEQVEIFKKK